MISYINIYRDKQDRIFVVLPWTDLFYELAKLAYSTSGTAKGVYFRSTTHILILTTSLKAARRLARALSTISKFPLFYDLPLSVRRMIKNHYEY